MDIKVSIITVCYQAEQTIERTLRSVSRQTYPHVEYIIIDGASRDNTLNLVHEISPQAICISEPDKGIYDAMNKGLRQATGEYVWFLNAGDALPKEDTVETMLAEALSKGNKLPDIIYGDCMLINEHDEVLGPRRLRPPHQLNWRSFRKGMLVCHQSFIARRELCPEYDLQYRFSADIDWCIRVMKRAHSYCRIDAPLSLYLHEGTTTNNHRASLIERFRVMHSHYGLCTTILWHFLFLFLKTKR